MDRICICGSPIPDGLPACYDCLTDMDKVANILDREIELDDTAEDRSIKNGELE